MDVPSTYSRDVYSTFKPELMHAQHPDLVKTFTEIMQPGNCSDDGFLAPGQDLVEICQKDAEILKALGITHAQIADRLEAVIMKANYLFQENKSVKYRSPQAVIEGKIGVPSYLGTNGEQECPFSIDGKDPCGTGSSMITIINLASKKRLENITELHAHLVRDHHFFEGNPSYRLDPELAIEVLGLEPNVDYKIKTITEKVWREYGCSTSFNQENLQAAKEHQVKSLVSEGGGFEAYLLPYYSWSTYKYRGLTNRQKIEKIGLEKSKTAEQIQQDIDRFIKSEAMCMHLDGSPIRSRLDEPVWRSDGQQYLHVFKFKDLKDSDKKYTLEDVSLPVKQINDSAFNIFKIHSNVYPLLEPTDRIEEVKED